MNRIIISDLKYAITSYKKYEQYAKNKDLDYSWAKSIIVFIIPYPDYNDITNKNGFYLPAKFAYGRDYHKVVHDKLEKIAKDNCFSRYEILCDISFLDEKKICEELGLGKIAKNNLLMTNEYGTRVFIGEILTNEDLPQIQYKSENMCLNCNICVDKCPTNSLSTNKNNCLSLLSQLKSNENYALYEKQAKYFGCDVCQDCCPINKRIIYKDKDFDFDQKSYLNIDALINMDRKQYLNYYSEKTFNWIGYVKMLRNIIVVQANNNDIDEKTIEYFERKYCNIEWFYKHLIYLKGSIKNGKN